MKIYAINGSPRKNWNSAQLLEKFIEGVRSVEPDAEIILIHSYDYNYTGCKSCFGCKLVKTDPIRCVVKDDLYDILNEIRNSDGFVIASPLYFFDLSAQVKALLERLMYPGAVEKPLPVTLIYSMNGTQQHLEELMRHQIDTTKRFIKNNFKLEPEEVFAFDTMQRPISDLYRKSHNDIEGKAKRRETQFPKDLQNAFEAGVRLVEKIRENQ